MVCAGMSNLCTFNNNQKSDVIIVNFETKNSKIDAIQSSALFPFHPYFLSNQSDKRKHNNKAKIESLVEKQRHTRLVQQYL